jgi:hypothetical protein
VAPCSAAGAIEKTAPGASGAGIAVATSISFRLVQAARFTPTSSTWMNLVERFFADLDAAVIQTGSFASVGELVRDIGA